MHIYKLLEGIYKFTLYMCQWVGFLKYVPNDVFEGCVPNILALWFFPHDFA